MYIDEYDKEIIHMLFYNYVETNWHAAVHLLTESGITKERKNLQFQTI